MDPTSFVASVLTLLGAAGASCEFLYNFILDISELPEEIHSQARKLQCLQQSISNLVLIYGQDAAPPELHLDPFLKAQLQKFLDDTQKIEAKIRRSSFRLDQSRTHQLRERLSWISSNRRMRKFYNTLDDWLKIFSTAATETQIALLVKIQRQTADLRPLLCTADPKQVLAAEHVGSDIESMYAEPTTRPQISHAQLGLPVKNSSFTITKGEHLPKRLSAYLTNRIELAGFRVQYWLTAYYPQWSVDLRSGPTVVRSWTKEGNTSYKTLCWREGLCLQVIFRLHRSLPRRFTLVAASISGVPTSNMVCNLTMHRILDIQSTPYLACLTGDWSLLRHLIQNKKVGISDTTAYGSTLLHIASRENHYDMVVGLLREGAVVDAENDFGATPLQESVEANCDYNIFSELISYGADLYHQDNTGRTPLHVHFNSAVRSLIEFHYTDIDNTSRDSQGMAIPQYVAWTNRSKREDLFRCCNGDSSCLEITNGEGKTPLHFACQRGNLDLVICLLASNSVSVAVRDLQGRTLLHYATESSRGAQVIELLMQNGADLHVRDAHGRTVMHYATLQGNITAVQKLIEAGALSQLSALDHASRTPFELAVLEGKNAMVDYLKQNHGMSSDHVDPGSLIAGICQVSKDAQVKKHIYSFFPVALGLVVVAMILLKVSVHGSIWTVPLLFT